MGWVSCAPARARVCVGGACDRSPSTLATKLSKRIEMLRLRSTCPARVRTREHTQTRTRTQTQTQRHTHTHVRTQRTHGSLGVVPTEGGATLLGPAAAGPPPEDAGRRQRSRVTGEGGGG